MQCILKNKIEVILLIYIYITKYNFINKKFIEKIYQIFEFKS